MRVPQVSRKLNPIADVAYRTRIDREGKVPYYSRAFASIAPAKAFATSEHRRWERHKQWYDTDPGPEPIATIERSTILWEEVVSE